MVKIKTFISRFLASEILPLLVLLLYMIPLFKSGRFIILMITFFLLALYLSFLNFILAILLYFVKISRIPILITVIGFLCLIIYLYYNKVYLGNDVSSAFNKKTLLGKNIDEVIILLCLIINQLLVKLYYLVWR
ncbi:hypothetical protein EAH81_22275 [Flavobacterium pectinovorum]|uniref:Uncharacterized protein n=1 Tax=Flavobacterium pectinovorum TaxID=29533 RepID=A0A502EE78_9FLAO|nr:hypothetical protein EAH81_22275 [Flavobacterium pectinovorum]